jgi:hypothetical protein
MYTCGLRETDFFKLYHPQLGGAIGADGSVFFKAFPGRQRGHGIGGIFGAIGRRLLPFLGKYVLPHAKEAIKNVALDVLNSGRPIKESIKERGINALKGIGNDIFAQSGSGISRKRKHKLSLKAKPKKRKISLKKRKKKRRKHKIRSIFD